MQMVAIREFYEKEGEMLPAKKVLPLLSPLCLYMRITRSVQRSSINDIQGISLTVPQYNALVALLPQIETALIAKGESVVRPDYAGAKNKQAETAEEETDGEGGGDEEKTEGKKNFEATSEEEEEG